MNAVQFFLSLSLSIYVSLFIFVWHGRLGFRVKLVNDEDMFVWEVALFGPPDTLYQGGYFKVTQVLHLFYIL